MEQWKGKVALVTGASAGIGYETAKQLALAGMTVVGCARNTAKIEVLSSELSASGGKLVPIKCDVTKEDEILAMFEQVKSQLGVINVLINNAGLSHDAPLLTGETAEWREMIEVNVIGLCVCTREFMRQAEVAGVDSGHIILLNSVCGHYVKNSPGVHFYTATKHAVTAITEGVRNELRSRKSGIKITSISPGLVRTEFRPRVMKADDIEEAKKDYDTLVKGVLEAEDIASTIIYTLSTPPRMQIHDIILKPTHQVN